MFAGCSASPPPPCVRSKCHLEVLFTFAMDKQNFSTSHFSCPPRVNFLFVNWHLMLHVYCIWWKPEFEVKPHKFTPIQTSGFQYNSKSLGSNVSEPLLILLTSTRLPRTFVLTSTLSYIKIVYRSIFLVFLILKGWDRTAERKKIFFIVATYMRLMIEDLWLGGM